MSRSATANAENDAVEDDAPPGRQIDRVSQLLKKPGHELDDDERARLHQVFEDDRDDDGRSPLEEGYLLKEAFGLVHNPSDPAGMADRLEAWLTSVPLGLHSFFGAFARGARQWREEILAYASFPYGTNYVESINRQVKRWVREERGNTGPGMLRLRILAAYGRDPVKALIDRLCAEIAADLVRLKEEEK